MRKLRTSASDEEFSVSDEAEIHLVVPKKRFSCTVVDDEEHSSVNETLEHINKTDSLHCSRDNKSVGTPVNIPS
jgi:hypothetical protein